jgi:hypothetical protein
MPDDEVVVLERPESLGLGVVIEAWDTVRERMHVRGGTRGYAQVNTDEIVKTIQTVFCLLSCFFLFFFVYVCFTC